MLAETQTVTINAVAKNLPRVDFGNRRGIFEDVTAGLRMSVAHQLAKRQRRTVRLDVTKTAPDPLLDGVSRQYSESIYLVIDRPNVGFSTAETLANTKGLVAWLNAAGNLDKVLNGEA